MLRKYTEFQYTPAPHMDSMHAQSQFHVWLFGIPRAPLSVGFFLARILEWVAIPPPGDHPDSVIKPSSHALQVDYLCLANTKTMGSILHHNIQKSTFVILLEPTMTHHYCPKCVVTLEFIFNVAHSIDFAKEHFQYF